MRWLAVAFLAICIMVPIGFYIQATGNFRGRAKLEPWAKMRFPTGSKVTLTEPIPVCDSRPLCAEARRMSRRLSEARLKNKTKDIEVGEQFFRQLSDQIKFGDNMEILSADPRYSQVRILSGPNAGAEGFAYTVGLEEAAPGAPPREERPTLSYPSE